MKRYVAFNPVELSDDVDELLELHSQAMSLQAKAEHELNLRKTEMKLIKEKLKKVRETYTDIHVTDHAVVRYLERVTGIDIAACKKEMVSHIPKDFGWTDEVKFIELTANGLRYVVRDRLIISVTPEPPDSTQSDKEDKDE